MKKTRKIRQEVLSFRESVQTVVSLLSSQKIRVVDFGDQAYCAYNKKTGKVEYINIPSIPDTASDNLLNAIRGFIDHEVAHVLFTDSSMAKRMAGKKAHHVWNVIEDTYIERKMALIFAGSKQNLLKTQKHIIENYFKGNISDHIKHYGCNTKLLFLNVFLMPASRAMCGHIPFIDFMEPYWDMFEDEMSVLDSIRYRARLNRINNSEGSAKLAADLLRAFRELEGKKKEKPPISDKTNNTYSDTYLKNKEKPNDFLSEKSGDTSGEYEDDSDNISTKETITGKPEIAPGTKEDTISKQSTYDRESDSDKSKLIGGDEETPNSGSKTRNSSESTNSSDFDTGSDSYMGGNDRTEDEVTSHETGKKDEPDKVHPDDEKLTERDLEELDSEDAPETISTEDVTSAMISDEIKSIKDGSYTPYTRSNDFMGLLEDAEDFIRKGGTVGSADWVEKHTSYYELDKKRDLAIFRRDVEPYLSNKYQTLSKDLERAIASKNRVQKVNGLRRGKINSSSLWKITVPSINDDRVFSKKYDHKAVNAAVQIVIDLSGSMGGTRIELAVASAYALSDALDKIRVPNLISGFTTVGCMNGAISANRYEPLFLPTLKNWNEKANSTTCMGRLGAVVDSIPLCNNVDGESILALSRHHAGRTEDKQIMLVLSDGAPCAEGNGFGNHLIEVAEFLTSTANLELLAVGIQTDDPARYYKYHTRVDSVEDLPKTVITGIRNVLLGNGVVF
ncbi:cobaltochelatase CobT-related protein [Xenorhabdus szentirmaii]|uniref:Cobalamin biosynthesis protein CobT VWA domain-containing protein n=1 Tax=Xenorhabdus szentirmaii DSM 16338 TaxID=1427518 RepID=W1ITB7_9GAMM|nr:hypothetical protein [Xenorhabdus szentirmaii]PHM30593.1 VWA domain-containing protein [Xenorhabdus szentirmaii DSM 16338]CDL81068.1 conserved hypothetical protein [Xenorhabdus szentirmaii DSM 16338]